MKKIFTLLTCLFFVAGILSAQDLTQGLVLHYPFDGNLTDAISGETADNNGNLTFEDGKVGTQAVRFSELGSYILTPDSTLQVGPAADGGTAGTYAMFVNHTAANLLTDRQNYIAQKNGCGPLDNNRGRVDLYRQNPNNASDPDSLISFFGGKPLRTNYKLDQGDTWIHLTLTFDPEILEWAFYADGVEIRRETITNMDDNAENSCGEYVIGHHLTFTTETQTFNGLMDDLRFYNRILTPDEITMLANPTSTKEVIVDNAIKLIPNPVAANQPINLTIDQSVFKSGSPIVLNIFDANGRKVMERKYDGVMNKLTLDHGLLPGIFTVTITDGEQLSTMKLVVL